MLIGTSRPRLAALMPKLYWKREQHAPHNYPH
jgi:hypothetical protein